MFESFLVDSCWPQTSAAHTRMKNSDGWMWSARLDLGGTPARAA